MQNRDPSTDRPASWPRSRWPGRLALVVAGAWVLVTLLSGRPAGAAPADAVDRGVGIFVERCGGCHPSLQATAGDLGAAGVQPERIDALWRQRQPRPPTMARDWIPVVQSRHVSSTSDAWDRPAPTPFSLWAPGRLDLVRTIVAKGHPLPASRPPWPTGAALDDLRALVDVMVAPADAAHQRATLVGWLVLAALLAAAWGRRHARRAWIDTLLPAPGGDGLALGLVLLWMPYVQLRPAPIDVLVPCLALWALATGAVARRAWAAFGLLVAWIAASAVGLVDAIPAPYEGTFRAYLAAELELPLLALCALGIAARSEVPAERLITTLGAAVIVESLAIATLLAAGQDEVLLELHPRVLGLPRFVGFFRDPNIFGGFHAFALGALAMAWVQARREGRAPPPTAALALVLSTIWLLASDSRAAMASLVIVAVATLLRAGLRAGRQPGRQAGQRAKQGQAAERRRGWILAASLLALLPIAWWLGASDAITLVRPHDVTRLHLWRRGLSTIDATSWLWGNGLLDAERHAGWTAPHATLVRVFGEQGLLRWALFAACLASAAPGRLPWRTVAWMGVGLWAPMLLVDVAHWRFATLVPLLALTAASPSARATGATASPRASLGIAAAALGLGALAAGLVWRADLAPARERLVVWLTPVAVDAADVPHDRDTAPDWGRLDRADELLEDAIRARAPDLAFARVAESGAVTSHAPYFEFELPPPGEPGHDAALAQVGCVAMRGPDPAPCPPFGATPEVARRNAWRAIDTGPAQLRQLQLRPGDHRANLHAALLAGLFAAGLAFALGHGLLLARDRAIRLR